MICWRAARSRRRSARRRCCTRRWRCERRLARPNGPPACAAKQHPVQGAEQLVERKAQQRRGQEAQRDGIRPRVAWRVRRNVYAHRVRSCRAKDWRLVLGKHPCCSADSVVANAIACCNVAQCGLGLEQRARCGVVSVAWRIGQCVRALCPRAVSVAPGGVVLSVAGEKHAILLSRVAFSHPHF